MFIFCVYYGAIVSHSTTFNHKTFSFVTIRVFFLPKHPGAAQMLRDVGAVDFLTQLSPNVEPRLRAVIDGTLDQLFQLPDLLPSQAMAYAHGSHAGAPTGVASHSQIFFSVLVLIPPALMSGLRIKVCVR